MMGIFYGWGIYFKAAWLVPKTLIVAWFMGYHNCHARILKGQYVQSFSLGTDVQHVNAVYWPERIEVTCIDKYKEKPKTCNGYDCLGWRTQEFFERPQLPQRRPSSSGLPLFFAWWWFVSRRRNK